jgi:hypothetical protein
VRERHLPAYLVAALACAAAVTCSSPASGPSGPGLGLSAGQYVFAVSGGNARADGGIQFIDVATGKSSMCPAVELSWQRFH